MTILRRARAGRQQRSGMGGVPIPSNLQMGYSSTTGVMVNDDVALSLPVFFRCIAILSSSVATLPLKAYQNVDGVKVPLAVQPPIITDPFVGSTVIEGLDQLMISLLLRGNSYCAATQYDAMQRPERLLILPPDMVRVQRDATGRTVYIVNGESYDTSVIIHTKNMVPPGQLQGLSLVKVQKSLLGLGAAGDQLASAFFANGATQTGFISVPEAMESEDARELNEEFKARHTGLSNAWNPGVLTGGATWVQTSIDPEDAQFLQSRQFSDSRLATLCGVPPHLLGMVDKTTSWGTGIEVQGRAFVDYTLRNYLTRIEAMFTAMLPANQWAEFDTDQLTRADTATRYANYAVGTINGWLNIDDVHASEGLAPLPDGLGQKYYHLATLTEIGVEPVAPVTHVQLLPGATPAPTDEDPPPTALNP